MEILDGRHSDRNMALWTRILEGRKVLCNTRFTESVATLR